MRNGDYLFDSGRRLQRFQLNAVSSAADCRDDRAFRASDGVGLVSRLFDYCNHVRNLLVCCSVHHVDNHWLLLSPRF